MEQDIIILVALGHLPLPEELCGEGRAGLGITAIMDVQGRRRLGWDNPCKAANLSSVKNRKKQKQNKNPGWDEDMGAWPLLGTLLWVMVTKHRVRLPHLKSFSTLELN